MYINAIQGSLIALLIFIIAVIYIPGQGPSDEIQTILTVSTFLFAIIAGFFISRLNSRYDRIRELIAAEDAGFLSLYKLSQFVSKNFSNRIRELIDKYYVIAFDFDLGKCYKYNAKHLLAVYDEMKKEKIKNFAGRDIFDDMTNLLAGIEDNRKKASVLSSEKLTKGQWLAMLMLAGIIAFSIFSLKVDVFYSQVTTVLLSTTLVLVLLIIRDLQNLRLMGDIATEESGQEIFEFIGKMRYHNKKYFKKGLAKIPGHVKQYRLGLHEPGSEKLKIKIVKNK